VYLTNFVIYEKCIFSITPFFIDKLFFSKSYGVNAFSAPSLNLIRAAATTSTLLPDVTTTILAPLTTPAILAPATTPSIPPVTTPSFFTPTIASLLINTGNPQVQTILALASLQPALFDYPLLLNSFINTGNSQVSLILALLSL